MVRSKEDILGKMSFPEFNLKCKLSFKFFVENMLGINTLGGVKKYQENWVDNVRKHRFLVIEAATGHAKTTVLGVWHTLWWCWKYKNQQVLVLSATLDQAKKVFRDIRNAIADNEILSEHFGDEKTARVWNEKLIATKEGNNEIRVVPYGSVRGYRAHLIYADEVDVWEDTEIYFEDVVSRLHPEGHIVLTSTPKNNTNLLWQIRERDKFSNQYFWIKTPAITRKDGSFFDVETFCEENFKDAVPTWPEAFSMDEIKLKWATQGKFKFISQQLVTILGETENAPFPIRTIYECYDNKLSFNTSVSEDAVYFIGADFANSDGEKADYTVYVVVEAKNKILTLKYIKKLPKGSKTPTKTFEMKSIYDIFNKYGSCRIVADMTNIGTEIIPQLRAAGMSVIEQPFQWTLRRELIQSCSNILQTGSEYVRIPRKNGPEYVNDQKLIDELQEQLAGFILIKSESGNENYKSKAPHDDIAIAFMMALKEASKMNIANVKPIISKKNELNSENILKNNSLVRVIKK